MSPPPPTAKTLTLWITPEEEEDAPSAGVDEAAHWAARCAGTTLGGLQALLRSAGADGVRVRVHHGLFLSRVVPTPEA